MRELTLGSLFDGLGGWLLAAKENGIRPIWSSEIDDFPMAVSKYHFPEVQQLGDITKLDGAELPPVDIICAGSPCQDLSIAGKREGLAGERSGLFRKAIDIVRGMRKATNGEYPKWFVWENVPGAFSSNKGHDFRAVLEEITETDAEIAAAQLCLPISVWLNLCDREPERENEIMDLIKRHIRQFFKIYGLKGRE